MTAPQIIQQIEAVGGVLTLNGDRIRYDLPKDARALLDTLRLHREEVLCFLRQREQPERCNIHGGRAKSTRADLFTVAVQQTKNSEPPDMPEGVRLLEWRPKEPPVAITTWAVVNDVSAFIRSTLHQLQAALRGEYWLAGNWSVRELVDRLGQCGIKVEVKDGTRLLW